MCSFPDLRISENVAKQLRNDCVIRYADEVALINNIDPYIISKQDFLNERIPDVTLIDIIAFFVYTSSEYTKDSFKNYKSLEACHFVQDGFIRNVRLIILR